MDSLGSMNNGRSIHDMHVLKQPQIEFTLGWGVNLTNPSITKTSLLVSPSISWAVFRSRIISSFVMIRHFLADTITHFSAQAQHRVFERRDVPADPRQPSYISISTWQRYPNTPRHDTVSILRGMLPISRR